MRALGALLQAPPSDRPPRAAGVQPILVPLPRAQEIARHVAAQIDAADGLAPLAIPLESVRRPRERLGGPARGVDPGLDLAAFAIIEHSLEDAHVDPAALATAYGVLLLGGAPTPALRRIVERLALRPALADAERDFLIAFLEQRLTSACAEILPDLVVQLARHEPLQPALFAALAKCTEQGLERPLLAVRAAAIRAGDTLLADAIFERWIGALVARTSYYSIAELSDEALFRRAARLALDTAPPDGALAVYQATHGHAQAAIFLDELGRHPARSTPAMRAAVAELRRWGQVHEAHAARYEWLRARVKSKSPG